MRRLLLVFLMFFCCFGLFATSYLWYEFTFNEDEFQIFTVSNEDFFETPLDLTLQTEIEEIYALKNGDILSEGTTMELVVLVQRYLKLKDWQETNNPALNYSHIREEDIVEFNGFFLPTFSVDGEISESNLHEIADATLVHQLYDEGLYDQDARRSLYRDIFRVLLVPDSKDFETASEIFESEFGASFNTAINLSINGIEVLSGTQIISAANTFWIYLKPALETLPNVNHSIINQTTSILNTADWSMIGISVGIDGFENMMKALVFQNILLSELEARAAILTEFLTPFYYQDEFDQEMFNGFYAAKAEVEILMDQSVWEATIRDTFQNFDIWANTITPPVIAFIAGRLGTILQGYTIAPWLTGPSFLGIFAYSVGYGVTDYAINNNDILKSSVLFANVHEFLKAELNTYEIDSFDDAKKFSILVNIKQCAAMKFYDSLDRRFSQLPTYLSETIASWVTGATNYQDYIEALGNLIPMSESYFNRYRLDKFPLQPINLQVASSLCTGQLPEPEIIDLNDGLIAYYPFNGNANDESGNGNHGTELFNYNYSDGLFDNAIYLSNGGFVDIPAADYNNFDSFTISIWVKEVSMSNSDGEAYIYCGIDGSSSQAVGISHFNSYMLFSVGNARFSYPFDYDIYLNNWMMYTIVYDNNSFKAFINDILIGETVVNLINVNYNYSAVGKHWWYSGSSYSTRFNGFIDDTRIYNRALSEQEIQQLYIQESPKIANFTVDNLEVIIGNDVTFQNQSTNGATSWEWDFNSDGIIDSTEENPVWSPTETGSYSISLTTWWGDESDNVIQEDYICVVEQIDFGLIAYYPLNGNAYDESGNGNHGEVYGATPTTDRFGYVDSAYEFDGINDYIDLLTTTTITSNNDWTFSAWVLSNDTSGYCGFANKRYWDSNTVSFHAQKDEDNNIFSMQLSQTNDNQTGTTVPYGWHLVLVSYESTENVAHFYLDGIFINSWIPQGSFTNSQPLQLGLTKQADYSYTGYYYDGLIDDVRIYNRALSQAEISELWGDYEQITKPTNITATESESSLTITWSMPADRGLIGFKVWRLDSGCDDNEANWNLLTPDLLTDHSYIDNTWSSLGQGSFRYAVSSYYSNGTNSGAGFSNSISRESIIFTSFGNIFELGESVYNQSFVSKDIFIINSGNYALDIFSLENTNSHFSLDANIPNQVLPGDSLAINVAIPTTEIGNFSTQLTVNNNSVNDSEFLINVNAQCVVYPPEDPENVNIQVVNGTAYISWDAVTSDQLGNGINPDTYIVYYSEIPDASDDYYFYLNNTTELSLIHNQVGLFSNDMYYRVVAYIDTNNILDRTLLSKKDNRRITLNEIRDLIIKNQK
ncbi:hypothetical protein JEZ13_00465 [bacterium]|nr:hypothetical protein [bacterium]